MRNAGKAKGGAVKGAGRFSPIRQYAARIQVLLTLKRKRPVAKIALNVDGKAHSIDADPDMPLLYALRDDLGLRNPKFGCGLAQCGACTVLVDGQPVRSCVTPVDSLSGAKVVTMGGLVQDGKPHKVQAAFIAEEVPQCGYCMNGWIMTTVALLDKTPKPTDAQIEEALTGLKCRCATHVAIMRAVRRAALA
jgi:aerobic-type carbon monoxide dehydrogenase small subunit (CoxS/CutS family)